ncbi:MAG: GAF domain-containing sensor histidine kinase [Chloroflexi bacterium]|nr:GAF domain-containing sensor histidine kinase [Chloroflexota bacterium]
MNLRTLKILTVFAPALFIGLFEVVRHLVFVEHQPMFLGNLVLLGAVLAGGLFFSTTIFRVIEGMQRQIVRRNQELVALNSVGLAVSESLDLDVILYRAMDKVLEVTRTDAGEIFLLDEPTQEMVQQVRAGPFASAFLEKTRFRLGEGLVGAVAQSREPMVVEDLASDERFLRSKIRNSGFRSLVCVPLKTQDAVVGVFDIYTLGLRRFTQDDIELMVNTGNQIAMAIDNARLHEKVHCVAVLEERERIAREMHDGLAQVLGYINTKTQAVRNFLDAGQREQADRHLRELETTVQEVYADVREVILGLRSSALLQRGMVPALKEYVTRFSHLSSVEAELHVHNGIAACLSPATEVQVIRIIQESLTNIRKHAKARHAWVRICQADDDVQIVVEDDGQGFDVSNLKRGDGPRFGLQTMKERAESVNGTLEVLSAPEAGTRVVVRIPASQGVA